MMWIPLDPRTDSTVLDRIESRLRMRSRNPIAMGRRAALLTRPCSIYGGPSVHALQVDFVIAPGLYGDSGLL